MPTFLSLSGLKDYLQIDWADDDTRLLSLVDAAEGYIGDPENGILGRPVSVTTFTENFPSFDDVSIRFPDEASIVSVTYTDETEQTLGAIYTLDGDRLKLNTGEAWPAHEGDVVVEYTAGFATVPEQIVNAAYFYAASIFEARDAGQINPEFLRKTIAQMVAGYRRIGL